MDTTPPSSPSDQAPISAELHPLLGCTAVIEAALKEAADLDPIFMAVPEKRTALLALDRLASQVTSLKLRVMAAAEDVADAEGHRDVASWMAHRTRADQSTLRRDQRLANACDRRWHRLGEALALGDVHLDQGHVISRALDALGRALDDLVGDEAITPPVTPDRRAEILAQAEIHLIEEAAVFGPSDLARLGARILTVVAPHLADDAEARKLRDEERHARSVTNLTSRRLGDGTALIKARVPEHIATRLLTTLEAFTSPRQPDRESEATQANGPAGAHRAIDATGENLPYGLRLGQAFCSLLEGLDPYRLPLHGGNATTVMITIDLTDLLADLGCATLADGTRITAGEARRLACTADLVPVVLGTGSQPLDLGLTARRFSPAQRRALAIRDQHCRAQGCDIPAAWCEGHHVTPWSQGGATDLANGMLLCSHHHHRIHDDRYLHQRLANGDVRFSRRR